MYNYVRDNNNVQDNNVQDYIQKISCLDHEKNVDWNGKPRNDAFEWVRNFLLCLLDDISPRSNGMYELLHMGTTSCHKQPKLRNWRGQDYLQWLSTINLATSIWTLTLPHDDQHRQLAAEFSSIKEKCLAKSGCDVQIYSAGCYDNGREG